MPHEFMTTKEVAAYLRIKERKVYELVSEQRIPCSRVAGKWLFPRARVEWWVLQHSSGPSGPGPTVIRPPVLAGSHDPLLEWCVRESGCELAVMFNGSLDGLTRLAQARVQGCGLHLFDPETADYNRPAVVQMLAGLDVVLIEWAWREQGLITAAGNPLQISGLQDLQRGPWRLVPRQEGAGSRLLLQHLLQAQGIDPTTLHFVTPPARSETDVALTIQAGKADIGFGIAAAARQCRLDFIPVHRERYDLALSRRDYFEPALQGLVAFMRPERLAEKAQELGGYDIAGMGRVIYNSP